MSDQAEQQASTRTRRGPGRPRKHPVEALPPVQPEQRDDHDDARVVGLEGVAGMLGRSQMTVKRLVKQDPTFPRPFAILGRPNNWTAGQIRRYVQDKAREAQAERKTA